MYPDPFLIKLQNIFLGLVNLSKEDKEVAPLALAAVIEVSRGSALISPNPLFLFLISS